ncbi:MAG: hypothetical protein P4L55_14280 [Syntrophobacteraceae bacterium]|nr:hypothetical protein [Syntrophobacteraceae bacterium]
MGFAAPVMAAAAPYMAGASIVTGVAGTVMQGEAAAQSADYMAQVARNNQLIAQQNANMALEQGTIKEEAQREQTGAQIGRIRSAYGAMGVEPNSGSALDVRSSAAEMGELNAQTIRYNAGVQAWNDKNQANSYGAQSQLYQSQEGWDVAGSILGGASTVSNKWMNWQLMGGGGNVMRLS